MKITLKVSCIACGQRLPFLETHNCFSRVPPELKCWKCGEVHLFSGNVKLAALAGLGIYCTLGFLTLEALKRFGITPEANASALMLLPFFFGIAAAVHFGCVNFLKFNRKNGHRLTDEFKKP